MDDLIEAIVQPIADLFDGDADDGGVDIGGGGPLRVIVPSVVAVVGTILLWLWW